MSTAPKTPIDLNRIEAKPEFVPFTPRLVGTLAEESATNPAALRYERRMGSRQPVVAAARLAIRGEAGVQVLPVRLVDAAIGGGVGLDAPIPFSRGQSVTLYRDAQGWPPQTGTVVRCEVHGRIFRLGVRMDGWRRA